jgi:2-polyprenyl-3-methyl-5-hydroxy-6-metoxy-1,4-benzoquinol methylase
MGEKIISTNGGEEGEQDSPGIKFESVNQCPVCDSRRARMVFADVEDYLCSLPGKFRYVQCLDCKLVYQDPRPVIVDLPKCYENYYTHEPKLLPESFTGEWSNPTRWIRGGILSYKFGYRHLAPSKPMTALARLLDVLPPIRSRARCGLGTGRSSSLPVFTGAGRALDVGVGDGYYAAKLARLGWQVTGVEFDPVSAEDAASRHHLNVRQGMLEEANFAADSFEFVAMFHVLEHLPAPVATLKECCRVMKPGGRLMIRTPNYESITRRRFGQYWRGLEAPRHLCLFNHSTLRRALEMSGFRLTKATTTPAATPYYFHASRKFRASRTGLRESRLNASLSVGCYNLLARMSSLTRHLMGDELHVEARRQ